MALTESSNLIKEELTFASPEVFNDYDMVIGISKWQDKLQRHISL
jgi:hypothetical protein